MRKREFSVVGPSVPDVDYARWISENEPDDAELAKQRLEAVHFHYRPLISIVMPVWNPPTGFLAEAITSVISQSYENWELRIADGASNSDVKSIVSSFSERDKRIFAQFLDRNNGISLNSNAAVQQSRGEFVALLDHDDLLAPNALFEVVAWLNRIPSLDFIYSDRDHVTIEGKRTDPLFKPDWSPDLMLCSNYATQLSVIRSTLLRSLGGFRPEVDGAQDWDLILRLAEKTQQIGHVPKILYHWRQSPSSVSYASIRSKPYAKTSQIIALEQYLRRNRLQAKVHHDISGYLRVEWQLDPSILISIIIFNSHAPQVLDRCINSILSKSSNHNFQILTLCDKNHVHERRSANAKIQTVQAPDVLNYAAAGNLGVSQAIGDFVIFLDSRIEVVSHNWLQELVGWCTRPEVGVAGGRLLYENRRIKGGTITLGLPGFLFQEAPERFRSLLGSAEWYRNCMAVSIACLATRKGIFNEVGQFNEKLGSIADADFCLRVREHKYRVVSTPMARLLLHDSNTEDETGRFQRYQQLGQADDPYFNPNLSYEKAIPTLIV